MIPHKAYFVQKLSYSSKGVNIGIHTATESQCLGEKRTLNLYKGEKPPLLGEPPSSIRVGRAPEVFWRQEERSSQWFCKRGEDQGNRLSHYEAKEVTFKKSIKKSLDSIESEYVMQQQKYIT